MNPPQIETSVVLERAPVSLAGFLEQVDGDGHVVHFIGCGKLPGEFVTSVGYVGTASVNGFAFLDINASQVPGSGNGGRLLYTSFRRTATTRLWDGMTHSNYHSLQATINRRFANGFSIGYELWMNEHSVIG